MAQQGDIHTARRLLTDSAELGQGSRDVLNSVRYLMGFARLATAEGQPERAVRLAGAAYALADVLPERVATSIDKWLAPARSAVGANASTVWDSGQRLSVDQATAYALSHEVTPLRRPRPSSRCLNGSSEAHGHRAEIEAELRYPRWSEAPEQVVAALVGYLGESVARDPRAVETDNRRRRDATARVRRAADAVAAMDCARHGGSHSTARALA
jgi:hypothetical protein